MSIHHLPIPVMHPLEVPMLLIMFLLPLLMLLPSTTTRLPPATPTHLLSQPHMAVLTLPIHMFLRSLNQVSISAMAIGAVAVVVVEEMEDISQQHRHGPSCTTRVLGGLDIINFHFVLIYVVSTVLNFGSRSYCNETRYIGTGFGDIRTLMP